MRVVGRASGAARAVILALTVVFAAITLLIGGDDAPQVIPLQEGQPSPQTFDATATVTVTDEEATEEARNLAAAAVAPRYRIDPQSTDAVLGNIGDFFTNVRREAQPVIPPDDDSSITPPTTAATTTTTTTTTTTLPPEEDGETTTSDGETTTTTVAEETTTTLAEGETTLAEGEDPSTTSEPTTTTSTSTTTTTLPPTPKPIEEQVTELQTLHPLLRTETILAFTDLINGDFERREDGEPELFPIVEEEAVDIAQGILLDGVRSTELEGVRSELITQPRSIVLLRSLPEDEVRAIEAAVSDLLTELLQPNEFLDDQATAEANAAARAAVEEETVTFLIGENIVRVGERVTVIDILAIQELGLLDPISEGTPARALALVAALVVVLSAVYMWRVAGDFWQQPKMVALFGLLVVLAAGAARVPELVARDRVELGFLLPAALFGYLAANLFDVRIAALMSVPVTAFTALATGDIVLAVFAAAATLTPVPLVSSVASRPQLNIAVVLSAVLHVPLAAGLAWFFYGQGTVILSIVWAFASGIGSGVIALGILPILSSLFGITTTQTLLDLTDRNHPALRLVEEAAPGTFNHSVMVGNLADRAARAVDANPLLARAMAYYHDLGKTSSPKFFVENQFGVTNPHDGLPPEESAAIIRSHVAEGLRLAREYRIPPDVAQGILTHHGTSLMRFFYHKADELYAGRLDPIDYRHRGRKPKSKEMVILMLADATEASTRALVQNEDPTSESIRTLVEQVIAEKVEDGQLEESDVTFGELTRIKEAFVDALIGYYHTRIPYPGFPAEGSTQPA